MYDEFAYFVVITCFGLNFIDVYFKFVDYNNDGC